MRVDKQHRRIRNFQADPDGTLVANPPANESSGDRGLGRALTTTASAPLLGNG